MHLRAFLKSKSYQTITVTAILFVFFTPCFFKSLTDNSIIDSGTALTLERFRRSIAQEVFSRRKKVFKRRNVSNFICHVPKLDPFLPEYMQFDAASPKRIFCTGEDYVKCYFSKCRVVDEEKVKRLTDFFCKYKDIIQGPGKEYHFGRETVIKGIGEYTLNASDYVEISCKISSNHSKKATWWKGHGWGLRSSLKVPEVPKGRENAINVVMFGFDSVSHNHFIRKMPKSYEYLKNVINATFLNGYNIVGDGTSPALFSLLYGKAVEELPEKVINEEDYIDHRAFIFHKLKKYGYRTAYFDDLPWASTFQYKYRGFRENLADHYGEAFYQAVNDFDQKLGVKRCIGDTTSHKLMMNITDQILKMEGNKFVFAFSGQLSHDNINVLGAADNDLVEFLTHLFADGHLNNTLLAVFGDHGPRFEPYRNTSSGRIEERLPLMAIRLPEILRQQRPEAQAALESNIDVLTTPHDMHATLLDAMDLWFLWNPYRVKGARQNRGLSLLEKIPRDRSCRDAGIAPHWCTCQDRIPVPRSDPMYELVGKAFVDAVNIFTQDQRNICVSRELESIDWVIQLSSRTSSKFVNYYQVKLTLNPKKAMYEATLTYDSKLKRLYVSIKQISRINA